MARRRKTADIVEELIEPSREELELDIFMDEIGSTGATVDIFRKNPSSQPHLGQATLDVLRENVYEYLRSAFGSGRYILEFRGSDRRVRRSKIVEVAQVEPLNKPSSVVNGNQDYHLQLMREHMQLQQTLLTTMMTSMRGPDIGGILAGIAAMTQAAQSGSQKPATATEMLTGVVAAITALKPVSDPTQDAFKNFKTMLETALELMPERHSGGDTPWSVVRDIGKQAVETFKEIQKTWPPLPARLPAAAQAAQGETVGTQVPQLTVRQWIETQLAFLKAKALAGKDPDAWVDYLLDNEEEPGCAAILQAIESGATFEQLLQLDAEIAQNPVLTAWFKALYDGIHEELQRPENSGRSAGDLSNTPGDARSRVDGQPDAGSPAAGANDRIPGKTE